MVIEGRLSVREDEPSKLMAESISPIEGYDPKHPQTNRPNLMRDAAQRLYVRLPSRSCPEYAKVINLLRYSTAICPSFSISRMSSRSSPRPGDSMLWAIHCCSRS